MVNKQEEKPEKCPYFQTNISLKLYQKISILSLFLSVLINDILCDKANQIKRKQLKYVERFFYEVDIPQICL